MNRVLFVSYYFPPSGGPGVQRTLKFVRYLPRYGWAPTVLTVDPERASYPALDPTLCREVPPDLDVVRTPAWDPYALYARLLGKPKEEAVGVGFTGEGEATGRHRLGRWIRANLFLPDARVGWVPFARRAARRLHRRTPFDVVLTSGPPHSTHLVGRWLKRRYGLAWVADFRDPWTDISWYGELPFTRWARRYDAALERSVLAEADRVVTVSPALGTLLRRKTPTPVEVIPNGFDPADFEGCGERYRRGERFILAHVGTLSPAQNPEALWEALHRLGQAGGLDRLEIHLVGTVDPVVLASLRRRGLGDRVVCTPYVPHPEAVARMCAADVLLLSINRVEGAEGIVTGKVYEYLAAGRPVLGIGPVGGDAGALLRDTGAGVLFDYDDVEGIAGWVARQYEAWERGERLSGARPDAVAPFARPVLTQRLADVLEATLPAPQARPA